MYREENLTIDLKVKEYNALRLKQMDTTKLNIELIDNGLQIDLANLDINIVFTKPNKTIVMQSSNITKNNNIVTVILLEDCLRMAGPAKMEVELKKDTEVVSSFFIPITIEPTSKENVKSDNTPNYIEEMENIVKSINQRGNELIEEIKTDYQEIVEEDLRKEIMDARKNYDTLGQRLDESLSKVYKGTNITAPTVAGYGRIKKLYGNTVEEGTGDKSPDNPYTLKCVGDDVNLLPTFASTTINGITFTLNADGSITAKGTATANAFYSKDIELPKGKYCLSGCPAGGNQNVFALQVLNYCDDYGKGATFELTEKTTVSVRIMVWSGQNVNIKYYPKIAKGSVVTPYSPYGYGTVENISKNGTNTSSNVVYVDKPLCSIGDVRDELDYTNKKITQRCGSLTINGSENWTAIDGLTNCLRVRINVSTLSAKDGGRQLSSHFKHDVGYSSDIEHFYIYGGYLYVYILKTTVDTVEEFKTWLSQHPVTVIYELATPITEEINCSDKIVQYADSTNIYNTDNAEIEVSLTNNETVSELNENLGNIEKDINGAKENINELNKIEKIDITDIFIVQTGYTFSGIIYKDRNHYFGNILIKKNSGYFTNTQEHVATVKIRIPNAHNTGCFLSANEWQTTKIGYAYWGEHMFYIADHNSSNCNYAKVHFDMVMN